MPKRTYQPKKIKRARTHGFLHRQAKHANVLKRRKAKKRQRLSV